MSFLGHRAQARAAGQVLATVLSVAAGLAVIGGAGLWGYRTQSLAWPVPKSAAPVVDLKSSDKTPARTAAQPTVADALRRNATRSTVGAPSESSGAVPPEALKWPMWEFLLRQPIPPRNPPLTPVPWRVIGAAQSAGTWSIIVMRQGKSVPEYFKTGDSLPGGYRIESITEEDVTLVKGQRPVTLSYIGSR